MQVLPIINQPIFNTKPRSIKFRGGLKKDVVNFSKKEFLQLPPKEIWAKVKSSMAKNENFLGSGGEAKVWKIAGTDYCIRIMHDAFGRYRAKPDFNLTEKDKVNHVVAKMGKGATIMKYVEGYTFYSDKVKNESILEMIDGMPQKAFDELFLQAYHAEKLGMKFDSGPCNILINPDKRKMTAIDFFEPKSPGVPFSLLLKLVLSLSPQGIASELQRKHCSGKIFFALLNAIESKRDIDIEACGVSHFIYSEIKNENRYIMLERFNALNQDCTSSKAKGNIKVLRALVKQLLL